MVWRIVYAALHVQITLLVWLLVVAIRDKDFAWEGCYLSTLGDNTMLLGNFISGQNFIFTQKKTTSIETRLQFIMCSMLHGQVPSMWKVKRSTTKYYRRHVSCMQLGHLNSYFYTIRVACKDLVKHMLCITGMATCALERE